MLIDKYIAGRAGLLVGLGLVLLLLSGCATTRLNAARDAFYAGQPGKSIDLLSEDGGFPSRERLLLFTERGMAYHRLGEYAKSVVELRRAADLMAAQEVISLSQQASSLVTTEWATEYKGEYCERLWVHTYLMMNYLLLYQYEDALVEAKQALKIQAGHEEALRQDYFTRALIALCYENLREYNDAYIEYKRLAELLPSPQPVAADLYRLALRLGFADEAAQYGQYLTAGEQASAARPAAELVLFVGLGRGPVKVPGNVVVPPSIRFSFPMYRDRPGGAFDLQPVVPAEPMASAIATDLGVVARAALDDRKAAMLVKETARVASKEALARAAGRNGGDAAEILVRAAFFVLEEPDTRGWETLPARLLLLRLALDPEQPEVAVRIIGRHGESIERAVLSDLALRSGQRVYRSLRY